MCVNQGDNPEFLEGELLIEMKLCVFSEFEKQRTAMVVAQFVMKVHAFSMPFTLTNCAGPDGRTFTPTRAPLRQTGERVDEKIGGYYQPVVGGGR